MDHFNGPSFLYNGHVMQKKMRSNVVERIFYRGFISRLLIKPLLPQREFLLLREHLLQ